MPSSPTVLIVEDDFLIRSCLIEYLEESDVTVLEAENCATARDLIRNTPTLDVLIMDVSLPDGSGTELGQESRALRPELPIIYTTGHGLDLSCATRFDRVMSKPYQLDAILSMVQELAPTH
ncbi:response regulator [Swaminathania salitolerans]|uniref:Response regulator n=1 Tax=Swaminathania salitolerans TaxID=182838 RepID=A0A511BMU7_9PROT|nr:response regulator [Swaminathania salitolerans]GBQ16275.1 two-component transcriptional regulator [Swaminathania salitolerans LMG 21291]GEL01657.1 response regulator [Swaminathania salitolerans]